jgi:hypothetical protein
MNKYQRIVFMQGDEATEPLAILDEQGFDAAIEYLAQWDLEPGEHFNEPSHGTSDYTHTTDDNLLLSWNQGLGYIGLERIV